MKKKLHKQIRQGLLPIHLMSLEKKKRTVLIKRMDNKKFNTDSLQLSPLYKNSI